ncbi:MAG: hypothetical protein ACE5JL_02265, partial [Dehalococcoidia bacterium]
KRMRSARDPEKEGIEIAAETIARLKAIKGVRGVHLMAVGWSEVVPVLLKEGGLCSRSEKAVDLETERSRQKQPSIGG